MKENADYVIQNSFEILMEDSSFSPSEMYYDKEQYESRSSALIENITFSNKSPHNIGANLKTDSGDYLTVWISTIPLVALVVINMLANGAILIIFCKTKSIRKCRNIYILSLAVADLFIGLSMPFSIVETLNKRWILSQSLCSMYLVLRYSLFFISILNIILLTVDRWWSINFPFSYRVRQSRRTAIILVVLCWIISFTFHIPSVIFWESISATKDNLTHINREESYCNAPFEGNFIFTLCVSLFEFIIPLVLLFVLNIGIYIKLLRRRNTKKIRRSMSTSDTYLIFNRKSSSDSSKSGNSEETPERATFLTGIKHDKKRFSVVFHNSRKYSMVNHKVAKSGLLSKNVSGRRRSLDTAMLMGGIKNRNSGQRQSFPTRKQSDDIVKDFLLRQDKKAILSLGLLALVAFVCWTPFSVTTVVKAWNPQCIPDWITLFLYWILAANSAINPFLYGIGNSDFRKVLRSWVSCLDHQQNKFQEALVYCQLQQSAELETLREYGMLRTKNESL